MWSYTNNKIKLLFNYNNLKTNIRLLCIYSNKNSTEYIIILHLSDFLKASMSWIDLYLVFQGIPPDNWLVWAWFLDHIGVRLG